MLERGRGILVFINQYNFVQLAMTLHASPHASQDTSASLIARTLHSEVELSPELEGLRGFAHKKFMPAIRRAQTDDDAQGVFTSSATNLATAGWMLTELSLRVSELSKKNQVN